MAYKSRVQPQGKSRITVYTDAPPEIVNEISIFIYTRWVEFATGQRPLNGRMLKNPSGKYAKSIHLKQINPREVAVIQNLDEAPEGKWIEEGHGPVDLKTKPGFRLGRALPMHRAGGIPFAKGHKVPGYYFSGSREGDFAGVARVGTTGWILPPMVAYHPLLALQKMAQDKLKSL